MSHAPRERVSWNLPLKSTFATVTVTLHVSVWVEISTRFQIAVRDFVTLHVSVWVEILVIRTSCKTAVSRSTWACELKYQTYLQNMRTFRHAPRERVSWNIQLSSKTLVCIVTLHVSVWVEILFAYCVCFSVWSHAPRERVSWNAWYAMQIRELQVTLHVSVWVEITLNKLKEVLQLSRSTWACELKLFVLLLLANVLQSRSTWACELK